MFLYISNIFIEFFLIRNISKRYSHSLVIKHVRIQIPLLVGCSVPFSKINMLRSKSGFFVPSNTFYFIGGGGGGVG